MKNVRNFLLCACFLAAVYKSNAETPVVNPAVSGAPAVPVVPVVPAATKIQDPPTINQTVLKPANSTAEKPAPVPAIPEIKKDTDKDATGKTIVPPPANATVANNTSPELNKNTTIIPIVAPTTLAPTTANTSAAPAINVTEVPIIVNVTVPPPCSAQIPSAAPALAPAPVPAPSGRYFDGLSFIGGMVLAVGLLGIGRVAFKIYKNRSDMPNYLTL